jgi:hypothetical protein
MRWVGPVALMGVRRDAFQILLQKKTRRNIPVRRCSCRWKDVIKVDIR